MNVGHCFMPCFWIGGLVLLWFPGITLGADATTQASAEARREAALQFNSGVAHADRGAWSEASDAFRRAYEAVPHFSVLYNLGQSYAAADRRPEALEAFERYLTDGGDDVPLARRQRVEAQIAGLRRRVATLQLSIVPADARVMVDGREISRSKSGRSAVVVHLLSGRHTVAVVRQGHERREREVELSEGQTVILELSLAPSNGARRPGEIRSSVTSVDPPMEPPAQGSGLLESRWLRYGLGITSLAAGGTALGFYLWNHERYRQWRERDNRLESSDPSGPDFQAAQEANNELWLSISRVDRMTWVLVAGAVVTGTIATFLFVRAWRLAPARRLVALEPMIGGTVVGLNLSW
jgi:tetratricopeptide (TPR) repeat protein